MEDKRLHIVLVMANNSGAPYFNWFAKRAYKDRDRIRLTYICMFPDRPKMIDEVGVYGWECIHVKYDDKKRKVGLIKAAWSMFRIFKKLRPDVVSTHLFDDSLPALFAAKLAKVPVRTITKGDTGYHIYYAPKWIRFDQFNNANATDIIAISNQNKELIEMYEKPDLSKVKVIHHGIPIDQFSSSNSDYVQEFVDKFELKGKKVIGNVSRLIRWKGQDKIIECARILKSEGRTDFKILLVGVGDDQSYLENLIHKYDLSDVVYLVGWVSREKIPSFYKLLSMYLHAAEKEPFGFVLAEALVAGTCLVSSDTGVSADVIEHQKNGFLYPEGDVDAMANVVRNVLEGDLLALREEGRKMAIEKLAFERMYNDYIQLFQNGLKR